MRTRSHNIISHLPGPKGNAKNARTPTETFNSFSDDNMLNMIVENTNIYISRIAPRYKDSSDVKFTNIYITEIKAVIGLLILAGVLEGGRLYLKEFWSTDGTGVEIFPVVLSYRRMKFLLNSLRFDVNTRNETKLFDNLAPIREL